MHAVFSVMLLRQWYGDLLCTYAVEVVHGLHCLLVDAVKSDDVHCSSGLRFGLISSICIRWASRG